MKKIIMTVAGILLITSAIAQVASSKGKIIIDGKLSEKSWIDAPSQGNFSRMANAKAKTGAQTEFKVLCDQKNIYIGIKCNEPLMTKLKAPRNGPLWYVDGVEIFMAPGGLPDSYYQFLVTAGNMRWCMYYAEAGVIRPDPYAPLWESATFMGKNFWSAELQIPLNAFYMTRVRNWKDKWLFNVARNRRTVRETSSWSKLNHSFHEVSNFRSLEKFTKKSLRNDIYIKTAKTKISGFRNELYNGSVKIAIEADAAAAGSYNLSCTVPEPRQTYSRNVKLKAGLNQFILPEVNFAKLGKNKLFCKLTSMEKTVAARYYPTVVKYNPMLIKLTRPGYRQTFYPGQATDIICGKIYLNLSSQQAKNGIVKISLNGPGIPVQEKRLKISSQVMKFSFATPNFKEGNAIIKAVLISDGKNISQLESLIKCPPPIKKQMVWVEDARLIVNGKPVYPRFLYATYYMGGTALKEKFDSDNLFTTPEQRCILEPERLVQGIEAKEATKDVKPSPLVFQKIHSRIKNMKNKDFLYYYLSDEPECRNISPVYLKYLYDYIKEQDPFHPVLIASREADKYIECADLLSTHPYIGPMFDGKGGRFLNVPISRIRNYIRDITVPWRTDKVGGLTPQFFSYAFNNAQADYPKFNELESMVWSSIVNGARMQTAYAYHDIGDRPALYEGLRYLYESIAVLENLLLSNKHLSVSATGSKAMLDLMLVEDKGITLLAVVNLEKSSIETSVKADAFAKINKLYEFRGKQVLTPMNNKISLKLKPYGVKVFTSSDLNKGLKTRSEVVAQINALEKARGNRGNILFGRGLDIEIDSSSPSRSPLGEQNKLFDGTVDVLGWLHKTNKPAWYELSFPKFVPKFLKIRLFGHNLKGTEIKIWKFGEWLPLKPKNKIENKFMLEYDFGKMFKTVKIRFDFPLAADKNKPIELYEIELIKMSESEG